MTYATENLKDAVPHDMLVILKPKIRITNWINFTGPEYYCDFPFGKVTGVTQDGVALTEVFSEPSLTAGTYYFDEANKQLYMVRTGLGNPATTGWQVVHFELYLATKDQYWYRDPLDNTSAQVLFHGIISESPSLSRSAADGIFGFSPIETTSISCKNDRDFWQEMSHGISFNKAEAIIYHVAGNFKIENITKLFTGLCGNLDLDDDEARIQIYDKAYSFDLEMDNGASQDTYSASTITDDNKPDPTFAGRAIRSVYGGQSGVRGVCMDYSIDSPTVTQNRKWAFQTSEYGTGGWSGSCTQNSGTQLTVSVANAIRFEYLRQRFGKLYIRVGTTGPAFITTEVTFVNTTTGECAVTLFAYTLTGTFFVSSYQNVYLLKDGVRYRLSEQSGYYSTDSALDDDTHGIIILDDIETTYSIASPINPQDDYVVADIIGAFIEPTINGSTFGYFDNPITILYHILTTRMGMLESEIDTAAFLALASSITIRVDIAIPESEFGDFPTYQEVITRILTTCFLRSYINSDGKYTINEVGLAATPDIELDENDFDQLAFSYSFDNVKGVYLYSSKIEHKIYTASGSVLYNGPYSETTDELRFEQASDYDGHEYLHEDFRRSEIQVYFRSGVTAADYAAKFAQILGERKGTVSLFIKVGGHGLELGDTVQISSSKLPGFAYDLSTQRTRSFIIESIRKQLNGVYVTLNDQKGIEDNPGSW